MKLRNKKTGGVFDVAFHSSYKEGKITIGVEEEADPVYPKCNFGNYDSLKEFCEDWEDAPAESLIKDEKIRKAIRAWNDIQSQPIARASIDCFEDKDDFFNYRLYGFMGKAETSEYENLKVVCLDFISLEEIKFDGSRDYTIEELCGDEDNN